MLTALRGIDAERQDVCQRKSSEWHQRSARTQSALQSIERSGKAKCEDAEAKRPNHSPFTSVLANA